MRIASPNFMCCTLQTVRRRPRAPDVLTTASPNIWRGEVLLVTGKFVCLFVCLFQSFCNRLIKYFSLLGSLFICLSRFLEIFCAKSTQANQNPTSYQYFMTSKIFSKKISGTGSDVIRGLQCKPKIQTSSQKVV